MTNQPDNSSVDSAGYLVVECFNPKHRRVNDLLATDTKCAWCHGTGIVRIRRDHVPVVRPKGGGEWVPVTNIVDQVADLND